MNAVDYIHSLRTFGKKAELKNIQCLLSRLDNPQKDMNFIHIAGTNGKGSVSSMINSIFIEQNKKVGLFTSPFLECFNERICVNNVPIPDAKLERITERVRTEVDALATEEIYCTVFDVICAVGFVYFKEQQCDVVVLEVGLGGRFDATNVIDKSMCSVICSIGLDHTEYLGETVSQIAFEKCGIIKPGCPVVTYPLQTKDAMDVIVSSCKEKQTPIVVPDVDELKIIESNIYGNRFIYRGREYGINLVGKYQIYNCLCAIEIAYLLGVDYNTVKAGLKKARWKCRFEVFDVEGKTVVLDGAHNPHGLTAFFDSATEFFSDKKLHCVFGMVNDKDIENSAEIISNAEGSITVTSVPSARGDNPELIFERIRSLRGDESVNYVPDNEDAIRYALQTDSDVVCVLGSLYMVGAVRKFVENLSHNDKTI